MLCSYIISAWLSDKTLKESIKLNYRGWYQYFHSSAGVTFSFCGFISQRIYTAWKVSKYGVISCPYFPVFGPEIIPYSDNFHGVYLIWNILGLL